MSSPTISLPPTPTHQRDPLIDNVRFVLVTLVVIGHFLANMRDNDTIDAVYAWIYQFHMPAFVFLSGLVISNPTLTPRGGRRIIAGLLAPLLIFTVLYNVFGNLVDQPGPADQEEGLLDPYWLLWFLAALALWRILVPVVASLRRPLLTTLALAIGFALMLDLTPVLSVDRFVVLMPFFVAGLVVTPAQIHRVRTPGWRALGAAALIAGIPVSLWSRDLPSGYITFDDGLKSVEGLPTFLFLYGVAAAMTLGVLTLVPGSRSRLSVLGTRTIYVYLLHGFFVRGFRSTELDQVLNTGWGLALVIVTSIALSVLLASDPVVRLTRPIVEPTVDWLFGDRPVPALSGHTAPAGPAPSS